MDRFNTPHNPSNGVKIDNDKLTLEKYELCVLSLLCCELLVCASNVYALVILCYELPNGDFKLQAPGLCFEHSML
jgi:hypothetical protein